MTHPRAIRPAWPEATVCTLRGSRAEVAVTILATAFCIVGSVFLFADLGSGLLRMMQQRDLTGTAIQGAFTGIVLVMQFSVFIYLATRLAQLDRHRSHAPPTDDELESLYDDTRAPALAVLVPSYKEDVRVIRRTLLSAALVEYPDRRVVLLIDNPPEPAGAADAHLLHATRAVAAELDGMFEAFAGRFAAARKVYLARRFLRGRARETVHVAEELRRLAALYEEAARALRQIEEQFPPVDHEDWCFVEKCLREPATAHRARADALRVAAGDPGRWARWAPAIPREYRRLAGLFRVDVSSFERKRFVNLSHEPNKAMNLNSYLGLMGRFVAQRREGHGLELHECRRGVEGSHCIPDAQYVITLDADSVLDPAYALKLVRFMNQPDNERVAVVQTPYSAFPGARNPLERVAGATTDIQYLLHQGFTGFNATFWVGANALLRKAALEDIAAQDVERGYPVTRYIQDNTVIEDTESSVDLVARGWRLHNYPERLAWSATPPDFGSLLIQRRRWANGGLIILPKFLRYVLGNRRVPHRLGHAAMGWHYLTSLATTNIGILALLVLPVEAGMRSWWLPAALGAYFALYSRDLVRMGYRAVDVANVYALTLLLVPVHLGGVLRSVHQMVTGTRTPFGRTPKVQDRTAVPLLYLAGVYGLVAGCLYLLGRDIAQGLMLHSVFTLINGGFLTYAVVRFVGLGESLVDLRLAVAGALRWLPAHPPRETAA